MSEDKRTFPVFLDEVITTPLKSSRQQIGYDAKLALSIAKKYPVHEMTDKKKVFSKATGLKNPDKELNADWKGMSLYVNPDADWVVPAHTIKTGYTLSPSKYRDGAFRSFTYDPDFHLPLTATDEELGDAILKAFAAIDEMKD